MTGCNNEAKSMVGHGGMDVEEQSLLEIRNLSVEFPGRDGMVRGVDNLTLSVRSHERLGVVGESGSGKSVMGLAMLGMVLPPGRICGGSSVLWRGDDMLDPTIASSVRGREIAMIFQDPMVSLNPLMSVGSQLRELLVRRAGVTRRQARARAHELLELVGIGNATERLKQFPFELSGGMCQRVMIATALACEPRLLIADEPTTGLDVTIQDQILTLLDELVRELGLSVVMITHDLGVVAQFCDYAQVMYAGRIVERSAVPELFATPSHPYTRGLVASLPRLDQGSGALTAIPGEPLDRVQMPAGCPFAPRCPEAHGQCRVHNPNLLRLKGTRDHLVACLNRDVDQ